MLLFPIKQKWSTKTASQKLHKKERARLRTCIVKSKPMKKISTYKISNQFNSHIHKIVYSKVRNDRLCIKISKLTWPWQGFLVVVVPVVFWWIGSSGERNWWSLRTSEVLNSESQADSTTGKCSKSYDQGYFFNLCSEVDLLHAM